MASFVFKKTEITNLKATGILDADNMTIEINETDKDIATLLSPFNGAHVEISVKVKTEQDLDEPTSEE